MKTVIYRGHSLDEARAALNKDINAFRLYLTLSGVQGYPLQVLSRKDLPLTDSVLAFNEVARYCHTQLHANKWIYTKTQSNKAGEFLIFRDVFLCRSTHDKKETSKTHS